jgi:hypothetical protein
MLLDLLTCSSRLFSGLLGLHSEVNNLKKYLCRVLVIKVGNYIVF